MPPKRTLEDVHRIHLMLDEAEIQAIDDYQFHPKVKIRTRSAAIRSLIELGLAQHKEKCGDGTET